MPNVYLKATQEDDDGQGMARDWAMVLYFPPTGAAMQVLTRPEYDKVEPHTILLEVPTDVDTIRDLIDRARRAVKPFYTATQDWEEGAKADLRATVHAPQVGDVVAVKGLNGAAVTYTGPYLHTRVYKQNDAVFSSDGRYYVLTVPTSRQVAPSPPTPIWQVLPNLTPPPLDIREATLTRAEVVGDFPGLDERPAAPTNVWKGDFVLGQPYEQGDYVKDPNGPEVYEALVQHGGHPLTDRTIWEPVEPVAGETAAAGPQTTAQAD